MTSLMSARLRKGSEKSTLQSGEAFPDGMLGKFGDAPGVQLLPDLLAVEFHGLDVDVE